MSQNIDIFWLRHSAKTNLCFQLRLETYFHIDDVQEAMCMKAFNWLHLRSWETQVLTNPELKVRDQWILSRDLLIRNLACCCRTETITLVADFYILYMYYTAPWNIACPFLIRGRLLRTLFTFPHLYMVQNGHTYSFTCYFEAELNYTDLHRISL